VVKEHKIVVLMRLVSVVVVELLRELKEMVVVLVVLVEVLSFTLKHNKVEVAVELEVIVETVEMVVHITLGYINPLLVLVVLVEEEDPTPLERVKMVEELEY
tara:strand:+ start:175 stop:480 length:306 start_codon:yes stop_codon:yes gene_type:complete